MKQWNKEDLILFYYGELEQEQQQSLGNALTESVQLQREYAELCDFLDNSVNLEVTEPDSDLNHNIMESIYDIADQQKKRAENQTKQSERDNSEANHKADHQSTLMSGFASWLKQIKWVSSTGWTNSAGAVMATLLLVVSVFYLGRMSVSGPDISEQVAQNSENTQAEQTSKKIAFDQQASRRVMLTNVSAHLEMSDRLFTLVSNGNGDLPEQIEERQQVIEELVALNRLYRRIAEKSGDNQLASVLQQMESILLELNHIEKSATSSDWQNIRDRVDNADLLFKLRVTNKKLNKEII
ncbi:hypothetical protein [Aliikangiella coralliicola]|uniref:Uncharacterized protein n=1 Tax=Aliikangiella coralliicola TaxID=2592383 RepID=A0A545UIR9_9GAMM|nr:hypothetical protein [Aliikangiella coralliicola]TQV89358.1 hypothetical protein FLL46_00300 [Aliikangiella coralliicola]